MEVMNWTGLSRNVGDPSAKISPKLDGPILLTPESILSMLSLWIDGLSSQYVQLQHRA
jgi:hypothetical protein